MTQITKGRFGGSLGLIPKDRGSVTVTHIDIQKAGSKRQIDLGDQVFIKGKMLGREYNDRVTVKEFLTSKRYAVFGGSAAERTQFLQGRVHVDAVTHDYGYGKKVLSLATPPGLNIDYSKTRLSGERFSRRARDFLQERKQTRNFLNRWIDIHGALCKRAADIQRELNKRSLSDEVRRGLRKQLEHFRQSAEKAERVIGTTRKLLSR